MSATPAKSTTSSTPASTPASTPTSTTTSSTTCDTCTSCKTIFSQSKIKMLYDGDFALDTFEKIALRWKDCIICLFYDEGPESKDWGKIFGISAQRIHGPQLTACNIELSLGVAKAFTEVASNGGHPYHWVGLKGYPFILIYRQGVPVASYSGDSAVEPFVDYCVSLACKHDYYEREILRAGVQLDKNYQMGPTNFYPREDMKMRTKSYEYVNGTSVRDFKRIPISEEGSQLAIAEQKLLTTPVAITPAPTTTPAATIPAPAATTPAAPVESTGEELELPESLRTEEVRTPEVPKETGEENEL